MLGEAVAPRASKSSSRRVHALPPCVGRFELRGWLLLLRLLLLLLLLLLLQGRVTKSSWHRGASRCL